MSYAAAWWDGYRSGLRLFHIRPFWRGKKYLKAWDNGFYRSRGGSES